MKDKWINIGYEGEELKPYTEPEEDFGDTKRIGERASRKQVPPARLGCSAAEPNLPSPPLLLGSVLPQLIAERGAAVEECIIPAARSSCVTPSVALSVRLVLI